ncbi:RNA polymerase sigma factor YlaC [Botrimarina colliarenosi]|uniref:RNA polymerase sigma factor n=1 Tax=Botrimarina colliarenosi TaxID=2528001 RepID=A0A5C6A898_9BACT|nr:sigma-70 family RNA polymerase sigma factor [Botrimarina colliarenosi]TWT96184.1 RNA polymerase sigma factor YlaC [Botrimarina colliarenosi]
MTTLTAGFVAADADPGLGDPEDWVNHYGDSLLRYALLRVGDIEAAEDLVQETLLAAWRGRDAYRGACDPRTWLISILKRRVADHYRRQGRNAPREAGVDPEKIVDVAANDDSEKRDFWRVFFACSGDLPAHLARAFQLRTFADAEPAAICATEGISRKNLSVRLHRARRLLRQCLESRWFTDDAMITPGADPK